jgi:signal peptidase II
MTAKISRRSGLAAAALLAIFVAGVDQISKIFARRYAGSEIELIRGLLSLNYYENPGAAFGIFSDCRRLLCTLTFAAIAAGLIFIRKLPLEKPVNAFCFGLIGGGTIGNLLDRIRFGRVADFIALHIPPFGWNTFNLADSALCCGVAIYILNEFLRDLAARRMGAKN